MESSLAERSDDDLEDRDDDSDNNFDVVVEEEESPPLTIPMPSSPSYTNHTIHSSAIATAATSATTSLSNQRISSEAVCIPIGECEFCPPKWRVMIEKEEQTIKDEYESCIEYGRRIQFECTVLFQGK